MPRDHGKPNWNQIKWCSGQGQDKKLKKNEKNEKKSKKIIQFLKFHNRQKNRVKIFENIFPA